MLNIFAKTVNKFKKNPNESEPNFILEIAETFVTSFIILMLISWLIALPEVVLGASMEPTIYSGERVLVERVTKHFSDYQRGDIVVLNPPSDDHIDYIKRVIGVPGDIIKVKDCNVYISDGTGRFVLEEPYLYEGTCTTAGTSLKEGRSLELSTDEYIVLGDNRTRSQDSRSFGVVTKDRILGKVIVRFWPPNQASFF